MREVWVTDAEGRPAVWISDEDISGVPVASEAQLRWLFGDLEREAEARQACEAARDVG